MIFQWCTSHLIYVLIIKKLKYIVKLEKDHLAYKEKYITFCIGIKSNKMKCKKNTNFIIMNKIVK